MKEHKKSKAKNKKQAIKKESILREQNEKAAFIENKDKPEKIKKKINSSKKSRKTVNSKDLEQRPTKKKKQNKGVKVLKFLLGLLLILIVIGYIINGIVNLVINPTDTVIVKQGSVSREEANIGYIIREETVVKGENYKNGMEQIIDEGQRIAKDESIFRYYTSGENTLKEKIKSLDIRIQEAIENNNEDLLSPDTKLLDSQISDRLAVINTLNSIQSIQEYKKQINTYVAKKAKIAGELSPSGSYLKKLIDERSGYENELNSGSEYIHAPSSGIVSYRVDGLEDVLIPTNFEKYTKSFLNNLNLKTGQIVSTSTETGKIINNFKCYIVFTSKTNEAKAAKTGDSLKITLPSTKTVAAKVENVIKEDDDSATITVSFNEGIDELSLYRKISLDVIWWDQSGYKVANSAIINENNLNYVIRNKAGYLDKVLVKLKKVGEDYSIVSNYSASEIKDLDIGNKVSTSILIYDELVLNPTEEQIKSTE